MKPVNVTKVFFLLFRSIRHVISLLILRDF